MDIDKCGGRQHTHTTNEQIMEAIVLTSRCERRKYLKELQKGQEEQEEQTRI